MTTPHHDDIDEAGKVEDFDAWRTAEQAARGGGKKLKVFGRIVELPTDLPLGFTLSLDDAAGSSDLDTVKKMVGALYGEDALDHWAKSGCGLFDFQVLLAYGSAAASGKSPTLAEVAAKIRQANAEAEAETGPGKARKAKKKRR